MANRTWLIVLTMIAALAQTEGGAQRLSRARIAPLPAAQWAAGDAEILGTLGRGEETIDVFKTCLQHRALCRAWMPFTRYILGTESMLTRRDRELLILRTSSNCKADYDWAHHVEAARRAGLSDVEIERVARDVRTTDWSPSEALLLRAADELHRDQHLGDDTWKALTEAGYSSQQLMDAVFTVGQYTMVSMFLNSAGVQLEPGFKGLPR